MEGSGEKKVWILRKFIVFSVLLSFCVLASDPALAKHYEDTKNRFAMELAAGWQLAPMPLDSEGMVFKKQVDLSPGLLRVRVLPWTQGVALEQLAARQLADFKREIGFRSESSRSIRINGKRAHREVFTMFANGDARFVRRGQLNVMLAYGSLHVIYFECLQKAWKYFAPDLSYMVKRYRPQVNARKYQSLIGEWQDVQDGKKLVLNAENTFQMKHLKGTYEADGSRLVLFLPQGKERFTYRLQQGNLHLSNANLNAAQIFRRARSPKVLGTKRDEPITSAKPPTREEVYGQWRVADQTLTEPLTLFLSPTGSMAFGPMNGRWDLKEHRLSLISVDGTQRTYHVSLNGGRMRMSGGDLDRELILVRAR